MEEICIAKLKQCRAFKEALRLSGSSLLVHNTETDPVWGCGFDMRGTNMMGKILMNVRQKDLDYQKEFPRLPTAAQPPPLQQKKELHPKPAVRPKVLVLGNSNARGMSRGLIERGIDATAYVYPGQSASQIRDRIDKIDCKANAILVHAGDIEVRSNSNNVRETVNNMKRLVSDLRTKFPSARLILSSLPPVPRKKTLNLRITDFNTALSDFCRSTTECVYLCNKNSRLQQDGIHMTSRSKDFICRAAAHHVKQCV
jgi:hypothetical protein